MLLIGTFTFTFKVITGRYICITVLLVDFFLPLFVGLLFSSRLLAISLVVYWFSLVLGLGVLLSIYIFSILCRLLDSGYHEIEYI